MFTDLNVHLENSESKSQDKGDFYHVTEASDSDGSFIVHHFLTHFLKDKSRVIFLALAQSFSLYNAVAQKLGVNLMAARTSGQLEFIDGLQYSLPFMREQSLSPRASSNDTILIECFNCKSLKALYKHLQNVLVKETGKQPHLRTVLLIDDLSILYSLGVDTSQIADFMQYCQANILGQELSGCIVSLLHCDDNEDEDMISLNTQLQHASTCHLMVEGLPTGFSKDVHGQLTITRKSSHMDKSRTSKKMLQFKITDKNVSFFPAGTSSAVL